MERYDVAIVGAGPEGLIAATVLARAHRRVIVLERQARAGGRAQTVEFHPGFKASAYADELPRLPARLYRLLDLARKGALLAPAPASACVSDGGTSILFDDDERAARCIPATSREGLLSLRREVNALQLAMDARALEPPSAPSSRFFFWQRPRYSPWPGEEWALSSLVEKLRRIPDEPQRVHLAADALSGRAASPFAAGSAVHLLAPGTGKSGIASSGLGALGAALWSIAANAGAVIRCGAEVTSLSVYRGRTKGVVLAGGEEVAAPAVLSTLDARRTLLSLAGRAHLDATTYTRAGLYRIQGQQTRILIALDSVPDLLPPLDGPDLRSGPIHVVSSLNAIAASHDSWQRGHVPPSPLVTLRLPSFTDSKLAPPGKAVMTAILSAIPCNLADGAWSEARRGDLLRIALSAAERIAPGISARVVAQRIITGPDIETALNATHGDLDGGLLTPEQMLGFRPFGDGSARWVNSWCDGRTPLKGLYLGGQSAAPSPVFLGVSGGRAARTILSDLEMERVR